MWKKLGRIFVPDGSSPWMRSHAANPVGVAIGNGHLRIYFSTRDDLNRSHIGYVVIDINQPQKILEVSDSPVVSPGELGLFDDSGTSLGCIVSADRKLYLYYIGWTLAISVPWICRIGAAVSEDFGLTFSKISRAPIIAIDDVDPFHFSYPWVIRQEDRWKMWYGSHTRWGRNPHEDNFWHVIRYATSADGICWEKTDTVSLEPTGNGIFAVASPSVLCDADGFHLWYAHRGKEYRIGYATSDNGVQWNTRDGDVGMSGIASSWDSSARAYPHVFDLDGARYMLYNGNGYGRTGFGLAVLE